MTGITRKRDLKNLRPDRAEIFLCAGLTFSTLSVMMEMHSFEKRSKGMKRKLSAAFLAIVVALTAAACTDDSVEYEEDFDETDREEETQGNSGSLLDMISGVDLNVDGATGEMNVDRITFSGEAGDIGDDAWTIFVYLCGTDLESLYGAATGDLAEMIETKGDHLRFVVETGGTETWNNEAVDSQTNQRYLIQDGEMYLVDEVPMASMADPETLADFVQWGVSNYASDHMGLILWDHGGGSISGVCFDEIDYGDSMDLKELDGALLSCAPVLGRKFDFIGFDACLMATVETANVVASYADYMVASQEIMPGSGYDYVAISDFIAKNPGADGAAVGKVICDSFLAACKETGEDDEATQSVIDLSRVDELLESFNAFAKGMYEAGKNTGDLARIVRGVKASDNYGGNNPNEGYTNMVDLGGIIAAGEQYSDNAETVRKDLDLAVIYSAEGAGHKGSSGLSMYYPLRIQGSTELSTFGKVCISPYYLSFVDRQNQSGVAGEPAENYDDGQWFDDAGEWHSADQEDDVHWDYLDAYEPTGESPYITFAEEPQLDEQGTFWFQLDESGNENASDVSALVYEISGDGEDLIALGESRDVNGDWETGVFYDDFDGYWMSLPDGQNLSIYLVEVTDDYNLYTATILLNGEATNLRMKQYFADGSIVIEGTWDGIYANGSAARNIIPLKEGDVIVPTYRAYSMEGEEVVTYNGSEYHVDAETEIYNKLMEQGDYRYLFSIDDIYGDYFLTGWVQFSVNPDGSIGFNAE